MLSFKFEIPISVYESVVPLQATIKANHRRKILDLMFHNWFTENRMDLGKDYLFFCDTDAWRRRNLQAEIKIVNPTKALLFKLACL